MIDFKHAIRRPFSSWKNLSIGAGIETGAVVVSSAFALTALLGGSLSLIADFLSFFSYFLIGAFLYGYIFTCAQHTEGSLPDWKEFKLLFLRGLKGMIVGAVYFLPFFVLVLSAAFINPGTSFLSLEAVPILTVITLLLAVILAYVTPMALVHLSQGFRVRDAFEVRKVLKRALTKDYLIAWLFGVIYSIVLGLLVAGVNLGLSGFPVVLLTVVNLVLNAYLTVVVMVTLFTAYGLAFEEVV